MHNLFAFFVQNYVILQFMSEIDFIDRNILRELERNGRISNLELAEKVGLSPSACSRRVQDLTRMGVIKGFKAVLNPEMVDRGFFAFVMVGLSRHLKEDQKAFEVAMDAAEAVKECHNITGAYEYVLRVEVKDLAAYRHFHTEVLGTVAQVSSIVSFIVMETSKS